MWSTTRLAFAAALLAGSTSAQTLHRSFWGMAYSPDGVILPNCSATQDAVTRDVGILAQLTPRIRLYAADCNQTALVLQGIQDAGNVDLSVWLGIYIDGNDTVYQRQMDNVVQAINTYGTDHIAGITVGNEYLLLSYGQNGSPTDAKGVAARTKLLQYVQQTNQTIQALNLNKHIPLSTADAGSAITKELCEGVDEILANVHPVFAGVPVDQAAVWTYNFFQQFDVSVCAQASNNPAVYIAETGWPTASDNGPGPAVGAAIPSIANLQTFLDTYVCQANANGTKTFFFEAFDEPWKAIYGGVEQHWGLNTADRTLKPGLTIPNCEVDSPTGRTAGAATTSASAAASTSSQGAGTVGSASSGSGSGSSAGSTTTTSSNQSSSAGSQNVIGMVAAALSALLVGVVVLI